MQKMRAADADALESMKSYWTKRKFEFEFNYRGQEKNFIPTEIVIDVRGHGVSRSVMIPLDDNGQLSKDFSLTDINESLKRAVSYKMLEVLA